MEVQITIEMEKVMSEVNKHFALIGKRLKDKNGDTMFAKTTLSSGRERYDEAVYRRCGRNICSRTGTTSNLLQERRRDGD